MRIGVLGVQGAVTEHLDALARAGAASGIAVDGVPVRTPRELEACAGLVLPGGESTTISRLLRSSGLEAEVARRGGSDLAIFGTCAGLILLCSRATHDVDDKDIRLLGLLDAEVDRNAFGRQIDSCETTVEVDGQGETPAVFIRAPGITTTWGETAALARWRDRIVVAEQGAVLATAFHPELTGDTRLHERFLRQAARFD